MKNSLPRNVVLLGLVSFFNDIAAEMIYPIIPIFLTSVLGTPVPIVGIIEGVAEATASLSKFIFGYISDFFRQRKPFVVSGYALGTISKLLIGLASTWPLVLLARFTDRLGKGLRTAARDSMLLSETRPENKGFIFGFHRAFDSLGAVVGPLTALVLLYFLKDNIRLMFFLAAIPSAIGVVLVLFLVKEKHASQAAANSKRTLVKLSWNALSPPLRLFLVVSFLFALGNSSDAFLLLQAKNLGLTTTLVVLAYVLYNVSQTVFAAPAGSLADRVGARKVFAGGLVVFSLVYFLFGAIKNSLWLWFLFPVYGVYIAATDGVSKAYIAQFIKEEESGTFFGLHQTLTAVAGFLASFIGGFLWQYLSPTATFWYGSAMAAVAFLVFFSFRNTAPATKRPGATLL